MPGKVQGTALQGPPEFTAKMRKTHTILIPMMCPIHFGLLESILTQSGYRVKVLGNSGSSVVEEGLRYVHNDTCYPALLVIGQLLDALAGGCYDLDRTALLITQTGGGCRASNYIFLLRKALKKAGYGHIPVVSLNFSGLEKNSGFSLGLGDVWKAMAAVLYGDILMLLSNQVRPYEDTPGEADAMVERWSRMLTHQFGEGRGCAPGEMKRNLDAIARDFAAIPVTRTPKVKVGVVGEIYVKYASLGNNNLEEFLAAQDCEVMIPGLMGFVMYSVDNGIQDRVLYGGGWGKAFTARLVMKYLCAMEGWMLDAVRRYPGLTAPSSFYETKKLAEGTIGYGCKMGEGWLLTAEMLELVHGGYENIICTQPFGCLPNHICGKGMMRKIKEQHPSANIVAIDYDPSATRVNQENRLRLMLSVAREQLEAATAAGGKAPRLMTVHK